MQDPFDPFASIFARIESEAEALAPAVRTVLDASALPAARAAAIAAIRAADVSVGAALRTIGESHHADPADELVIARAVFEAVVADPAAADLERAAHDAVELAATLGQHAEAIDLATRALDVQPSSVPLAILQANSRANHGTFDPAALAALARRDIPSPGMKRRIYANLGVALLATGHAREGLDAWRHAASDPEISMAPDVAVLGRGEPVWIQRMRALLRLDGIGRLAATWGIGGPRMIVLLEGLATSVPSPDDARILRAEADARLREGCARFAVHPAEPDVTLEALLADAEHFARTHGLDEIATRIRTASAR